MSLHLLTNHSTPFSFYSEANDGFFLLTHFHPIHLVIWCVAAQILWYYQAFTFCVAYHCVHEKNEMS